MQPEIRKYVTYDEEVMIEGFRPAEKPWRIFAVAAVARKLHDHLRSRNIKRTFSARHRLNKKSIWNTDITRSCFPVIATCGGRAITSLIEIQARSCSTGYADISRKVDGMA